MAGAGRPDVAGALCCRTPARRGCVPRRLAGLRDSRSAQCICVRKGRADSLRSAALPRSRRSRGVRSRSVDRRTHGSRAAGLEAVAAVSDAAQDPGRASLVQRTGASHRRTAPASRASVHRAHERRGGRRAAQCVRAGLGGRLSRNVGRQAMRARARPRRRVPECRRRSIRASASLRVPRDILGWLYALWLGARARRAALQQRGSLSAQLGRCGSPSAVSVPRRVGWRVASAVRRVGGP